MRSLNVTLSTLEKTACLWDENLVFIFTAAGRIQNGCRIWKFGMLEFRSDTFTLPSAEMMAAIASAQLGDDGYREDPTVIRLEELAASMLGKEAACLMPSGTMANLASVMVHCPVRDSVALIGDQSDIHVYEDKGLAGCTGVIFRPLHTQPDGTILLTDIARAFSEISDKPERISMVCLENPHNLSGGIVLSLSYVSEVAALVHHHGAQLHMDGARIFNAAVKLKLDPADLVRDADSLQFCLSKGLAAPIGSLAVGSSAYIEKIRSKRKMLGGNMRQAGIIAAAGIVALEKMVSRLAEDHRNARQLAEGLARMPGIQLDLSSVQTNTVVFRVVDPRFDYKSFIQTAWHHGMRLSEFKRGRIRAVTHYGLSEEDIKQALEIFKEVLKAGPALVNGAPLADGVDSMGKA
jgi:threonine aldolase